MRKLLVVFCFCVLAAYAGGVSIASAESNSNTDAQSHNAPAAQQGKPDAGAKNDTSAKNDASPKNHDASVAKGDQPKADQTAVTNQPAAAPAASQNNATDPAQTPAATSPSQPSQPQSLQFMLQMPTADQSAQNPQQTQDPQQTAAQPTQQNSAAKIKPVSQPATRRVVALNLSALPAQSQQIVNNAVSSAVSDFAKIPQLFLQGSNAQSNSGYFYGTDRYSPALTRELYEAATVLALGGILLLSGFFGMLRRTFRRISAGFGEGHQLRT